MLEVLTYDDIVQQYCGNLVRYQGRYVKVTEVNKDCSVNIWDLEKQSKAKVPFNLSDFKPPSTR